MRQVIFVTIFDHMDVNANHVRTASGRIWKETGDLRHQRSTGVTANKNTPSYPWLKNNTTTILQDHITDTSSKPRQWLRFICFFDLTGDLKVENSWFLVHSVKINIKSLKSGIFFRENYEFLMKIKTFHVKINSFRENQIVS